MPVRRVLACLFATAVGLGLGAAGEAGAAPRRARACVRQTAQRFLIRSSFVKKGRLQAFEHRRALRWRIEKYGRVPGVPFEKMNPVQASAQAVQVRFFGLPLRIHAKVAPALACVERDIQARCTRAKDRYVPRAVGGFREANTYRGGEVSNHLFGIALDIDPDRNPCCGCVDPWPSHPACRDRDAPIWDKTELPRCWVDAFERHGFYWLGHDTLQDTMHFEYLADPDRRKDR